MADQLAEGVLPADAGEEGQPRRPHGEAERDLEHGRVDHAQVPEQQAGHRQPHKAGVGADDAVGEDASLLPGVLSEEQLAKAEKAAEKTAVLKSANMSLGINLLLKLLKDAAKVLAPAGYDIELVEKHHNQKLDAPSGTALALADSVNEALGNEYHYVYDRSTVRQKRDAKEIGISALRGGTIVGEHEVIFAGTDEVIEFKHTAYSRSVFGKGAVEAAKFLAGKESGMYDMSDVVGL